MNATDQSLLDLLVPGEFLRFLYLSRPQGTFQVAVEGGGGTGDLSERVGMTLAGLRGHGYAFGRSGADAGGAAENARRLELRPRSTQTSVSLRGDLGFGPDLDPAAESLCLHLPRWSHAATVAAGVAELFRACRDLTAVEVEFSPVDLSTTNAALLQRVLDLRLAVARGAVPESTLGRRPLPSREETYLALWLLEGCGWEVSLRLALRAGTTMPHALLQMAGRAFFQCECELFEEVPPSLQSTAGGGSAIDLSRCFPRGWSFPALLPAGEDLDAVAARRLHNRTAPKLPDEGLLIGAVEGRRVRIPSASRDRHTYVVGATGTGKSTLLERMIVADLHRGESVVVLDPHGDLYHRLIPMVPASRRGDLLCLDPAGGGDASLPGFNVLDLPREDAILRRQRATGVVDSMLSLFDELWDMRSAGGPMFELYFRNTLLLMALQSEKGGHRPHLGHFTKVLNDEEFRKRLLVDCEDQDVIEFWTKTAEKVKGDARIENIAPYITSKVAGLVQGGFISRLLCAEPNELDLRQRMDKGGIIFINLDKGRLGSRESRLLGTLLMQEIFSAGLARSAAPPSQRRPVNLYADEFQNFVSDNVAAMLSEARKFGLRLTLANQTLAQLNAHRGRQDMLETVLGNVGNLIAFRLGVLDAERLRLFLEPLTPTEMKELPNFHAFARLLTAEGPIRPFVFRTLGPRRRSTTDPRNTPSPAALRKQRPAVQKRKATLPPAPPQGPKESRTGKVAVGKSSKRKRANGVCNDVSES